MLGIEPCHIRDGEYGHLSIALEQGADTLAQGRIIWLPAYPPGETSQRRIDHDAVDHAEHPCGTLGGVPGTVALGRRGDTSPEIYHCARHRHFEVVARKLPVPGQAPLDEALESGVLVYAPKSLRAGSLRTGPLGGGTFRVPGPGPASNGAKTSMPKRVSIHAGCAGRAGHVGMTSGRFFI